MIRPANLRENRWQVAPAFPPDLRQKLGHLHPVLLQVLYNRGLTSPAKIQSFLENRYLASTDPFLLPDMDKAVARVRQAIENEEQVVIYGDFDADGVTSTVLLTEALRGLGLPRRLARPYIPDRVDEGYGLNFEALSKIREEMGASLVITVDCGIRSVAEVAHANSLGLDMIITDHHSIGAELPPALAVVNPKRPSSQYPEEMLAGVGIAFKLAQALRMEMPDRANFKDDKFLDLVAIGTVADLAPLLGENRKLVQDGLVVLNRLQRPGLVSLARLARLQSGRITAESIGFGIGPRINAAGRLDKAYTAAKLLATNNSLEADRYASELNDLNRQRQQLTRRLSEEAEEMISPDAPILIAEDESFISGIVGLVASRLAEKNYRPAIVIEKGETESRGSCRSIPEFHITEALDETADLLVRHGGHAQAAGFTVSNENLEAFKIQMELLARSQLGALDLRPAIPVDVEIELEMVDQALFALLQQLEPTGYANPTPVFMSRNVGVAHHRRVGQDGSHLQLRFATSDRDNQRILPAIAFRQGAWAEKMPSRVDIVYTIGLNEFRGRTNLQLVVKDMRPAAELF